MALLDEGSGSGVLAKPAKQEETFQPGAPPPGYQWIQMPAYDQYTGEYVGSQWSLVPFDTPGGGGGSSAPSYQSGKEAFDRDLEERIKAREQRLQEIEAQEGHADARQKEALAAEKERLQMQLDNDRWLQKQSDETKMRIATFEGAVGLRGQDVTRELGLKNLAQDYLGTAAQMAGTGDSMRSAAYLLGDEGSGITPIEAGLAQMKQIASATAAPPMPMEDVMSQYGNFPIDATAATGLDLTGDPVAQLPPLTAVDALKAMRAGDNERGNAILAFIAGTGPDPRLTTKAPPIGTPMPGPRLPIRPRPRALPMPGRTPIAPPKMIPPRYPRPKRDFNILVGEGSMNGDEEIVQIDPMTNQLKKIVPINATAATGMDLTTDASPMGWEAYGSTPGPVSAPYNPVTPPTGIYTLPADPDTWTAKDALALLRAGDKEGSDKVLRYVSGAEADKNAIKAELTTHNVLGQANYGAPPPEAGYDIFSGRPLFGVDLQDPKKMAATFFRLPADVQKQLLSGAGMRNMDANEYYRRMAVVTPISLNNARRIVYG